MSVLSFPRIYFKGFMSWDPCTFNNNDFAKFPTYDAAHAELNWDFLSGPGGPDITRENFPAKFRPWAITLQDDENAGDNPPNGAPGKRIPAEWNMFGTHAVSFLQYNDYTTTITGGDLGYGQPVTKDPLIGGVVGLSGDSSFSAAKLVDTNPICPWSSQIYFGGFSFGSGASGFTGQRAPDGYRMHSRWLNPNRIFSAAPILTSPASSIGVCFQTGIPYAQVAWPASTDSPLITALQKAAQAPGALGIMVRFTAYVNLYFMNGILNNMTAQPRTYEELAVALQTAWAAWNANGDSSEFFSNPCYSHVVGVVGVWDEGELASVPGGRCLAGHAPVSPLVPPAPRAQVPRPTCVISHTLGMPKVAPQAPAPLGPVAVEVDYDAAILTLDFSGTMPEAGIPGSWPSNLEKSNYGPLSVGVQDQNSNFTSIVTLEYAAYQQSAYEAKAGIIDIPFPNLTVEPTTAQLLQSGTLAIRVQGQTALLEQPFTAETETRGIYLDQQGQTEITILVNQAGAASPQTPVLVAQYDAGLNLVANTGTQYVGWTTGKHFQVTSGGITSTATVLVTDANGNATLGISAGSPGFPVLAFFPFAADGLPPEPPARFDFTDDAFYATVRVLPFDDLVPQAFVDVWNNTGDRTQAWNFIYNNVLYVYDMLFNVMLEFVNLGNQSQVEDGRAHIWPRISLAAAQESTGAMPVTRDMSAGKRLALQLWIYLVDNNYNVANFSVNSIPADWPGPQG